jgi:hypothetical protein
VDRVNLICLIYVVCEIVTIITFFSGVKYWSTINYQSARVDRRVARSRGILVAVRLSNQVKPGTSKVQQ